MGYERVRPSGGGLRAGASLAEVVQAIGLSLQDEGIDAPQFEARRLLWVAIGMRAETLLARPETVITELQIERLRSILERRLAREPLGRIEGKREFYGRVFGLSDQTLEPRPDSETLIEATLEVIAMQGLAVGGRWQGRADEPLRVLDVGTGSGCLLITLLAELPNAVGLGTDISHEALVTAAANAERHGVSDRVEWRRTPGLEGIAQNFDVLVSNPPYIPTGEISDLAPEVCLHDPLAALDGGDDGLMVYRQIASRTGDVAPDGVVILEVAAGDEKRVTQVFRDGVGTLRIENIGCWQDLGGHVRCVAMKTLCLV